MAYEKHITPTALAPAQAPGPGGWYFPTGGDSGEPEGDGNGGDGNGNNGSGGGFWNNFMDWLFKPSEGQSGLDKLIGWIIGGRGYPGGGGGSGGMDATAIAMVGGVLLLILIIVFGVVIAWKRS